MTKSKIKLLSNTIIIIFLCSVLYTTLNIQNKPPSHYSSSSNMIEGTITKCNKKSFILKGKEKVIINKNQQFNCQEGIKIKAIGKFEKARSFNNFHIFNYQKYLYSQRISYVIVNPRIIKLNAKISPHYTLKNMLVKHMRSL